MYGIIEHKNTFVNKIRTILRISRYKMNDFEEIMHKIKTKLNINSDSKMSEILGISKGNYSERKQRNSIPYENLIILCKKEKISIDLLFKNEENNNKKKNFKEKLNISTEKLNEKEAKYFYYLIESKLAEKEI